MDSRPPGLPSGGSMNMNGAHPASGSSNNSSSHMPHSTFPAGLPIEDPSFDIVAWYPAYQSCQRYFLNHAQHSGLVQAVAAFVNIRLPFQWHVAPVVNVPTTPVGHANSASSSGGGGGGGGGMFGTAAPGSAGSSAPGSATSPYFPLQSPSVYPPSAHQAFSGGGSAAAARSPASAGAQSLPFVSLVPYLRRLIVTGFDTEGVLHGFFGSDWAKGVVPLQAIERRNFMFAAKSVGWAKVKGQYDMGGGDESVPFLKPLQRVQLGEIERAEKAWSEWLAMEDWMVGPRAPGMGGGEAFGLGRGDEMMAERQDRSR